MNGFYGSAFGNILGTLYFLLFQCVGVLYIKRIFPEKGLLFHLLTGSVSGSVLLQWIPALFAFFFGFSMTAHIMALLFVVICLVLLYVFYHPATAVSSTAPTKDYRQLLRRNYAFLLLAGGTFVLFCILLSTHTILPKDDGLHVGQCTYGDLQMHLGIITSIANQQTFPPYYSISPWDRLCYPFLCDSISSSIYLFGASLRYAYMLPMYFAFFQVITGFYAMPMFCSMIAPNLWLPGSYFSITAVLASYISLTGAEKAVINSVIFLLAITLPPPIWSTGISAGSISSQICSCHSVQHSLAMRSCSVPSGCCFGPSGTGKKNVFSLPASWQGHYL